MRYSRSQFLQIALSAATFSAFAITASAQIYPLRPIILVVPSAAGGPQDFIARILAERLRTALGQPVIVENVSGAAGSIGAGQVARAAPDGNTLVLGQFGTHVLNGALYALPYDVQRDFEPISLVADSPMVIVGRKDLPANDLKELILWLKANPNKASQGVAGSAGHVAGIYFQKITGTQLQFVPYRGAALSMQDLVTGLIDLVITSPVTSIPQIRAGTVKAFAITANSRLPQASDIPTVDEAGLPEFYVSFWSAFFAPKGTPQSVIAKLNDAVVLALADINVRAKFQSQGLEIPPPIRQTPDELAAFQGAEIKKWWPIVKGAGVRPN